MNRKCLVVFGLIALFVTPQTVKAQDAPSIEELFNYLKGSWYGSSSGSGNFREFVYVCHYWYSSTFEFTFEKILKVNPRSAFLSENKTAQIVGRYLYTYRSEISSITKGGRPVDEGDFQRFCNLDVPGGGKVSVKKNTYDIVLWPTARTTAAVQATLQTCTGNDCAGEASGEVMERTFEFIDDSQMFYIAGDKDKTKVLLKRSQ